MSCKFKKKKIKKNSEHSVVSTEDSSQLEYLHSLANSVLNFMCQQKERRERTIVRQGSSGNLELKKTTECWRKVFLRISSFRQRFFSKTEFYVLISLSLVYDGLYVYVEIFFDVVKNVFKMIAFLSVQYFLPKALIMMCQNDLQSHSHFLMNRLPSSSPYLKIQNYEIS